MRSILRRLAESNGSLVDVRDCCARLLIEFRLVSFGRPCRLREIEFYHYSTDHPDPFTHCHEIQSCFGGWYVHRVGKGYKSGSFKGLDFTFGRNGSFGGILIRSIERADGSVVCGPSLCVDNFINAGSFNNVGELDKAVAGRPVWDEQNPLHFAPCDPNQNAVFATARVGLNGFTIQDKSPWEYVVKRHRFLCGPREIKKGRIHLILAMHQDGAAIDEIHQVTGSPRSAIQRHIDFYESSRDMTLDEVENLKPTEMTCALHHRSQ